MGIPEKTIPTVSVRLHSLWCHSDVKISKSNSESENRFYNPKCQSLMQFSIYIVESMMQNTSSLILLQCKSPSENVTFHFCNAKTKFGI